MRLQSVRLSRALLVCGAFNVFCIFAVFRLYTARTPDSAPAAGRKHAFAGPLDSAPPADRKYAFAGPLDSAPSADREYDATGHGESGRCPSLRQSAVSPASAGEWQTVGDREAFVYSAYYDDRPGIGDSRVRVIALTTDNFAEKVFVCHLWYRDKTSSVVVDAASSYFGEGHEKKYDSTFYECLLPKTDQHTAPHGVSIVTSRCERATYLLDVHPVRAPVEPAHDFKVCVTPLNFRFDNHNQLTEMVEVNRMFGATNFVFYNYSSGHRVGEYLRAMKHEQLVDVVPWPLPVFVDTWPPNESQPPEVHYFAQVAALNDCLYRYMSASRYIVFTDLDEFIVPQGAHATWISALSEAVPGGAYMFRNAFFWRDWPDDVTFANMEAVRRHELVTLLKTKRQEELNPFYERSKCIVAPPSVVAMGVHNVVAFAGDASGHVEVEPSLGMVYHYRGVLTPSDVDVANTRDRRMHSFATGIIRKVARRHRQVDSYLKKLRLRSTKEM